MAAIFTNIECQKYLNNNKFLKKQFLKMNESYLITIEIGYKNKVFCFLRIN